MAHRIKDPEDAIASARNMDARRALARDLEADLTDNWKQWDVSTVNTHERALNDLRREYGTVGKDHDRANERAARSEEKAEKQHQQRTKATKKAARRRTATKAGKAAARGYGRRRARNRYLEQTGIPGFGRSTTSLTLQVLGGLVGLSALYLILSPNGSKAYASLMKAVTIGVRAVVEPVDPIAPRAKKQTKAEKLAAANDAGDIPQLTTLDDLADGTAGDEVGDAIATATRPTVRRRPPASYHHNNRRRTRRP